MPRKVEKENNQKSIETDKRKENTTVSKDESTGKVVSEKEGNFGKWRENFLF